MKKILFLFIALSLIFQSCLHDDDDKFNENATERVNQTISKTNTILESAKNGWLLQYFPELKYGGYNYLISFDGSMAKISMELYQANKVDSCYYRIRPETGAIISFQTHSEMMDYFRAPSSSKVNGMGGDFEFIITSVSETLITLKGKTTGNEMYLTPVPEDISWNDYLEQIKSISNTLMDGNYGIYVAGDSIGYTKSSANGRYLQIFEGDSLVSQSSIIFTDKGFKCYDKFKINSIESKEFTFDKTTKKLTSDNNQLVLVANITPRLAYDDYLGDWKLQSDDYDDMDVKLEVDTYGKSYKVTGIQANGNDLSFIIQYENGNLKIFPHYACPYEEAYMHVCLSALLGTSGYIVWSSAEANYEGSWNLDNTNPIITFKDNGSYTGYIMRGIYLYVFNSEIPSGDGRIGNLYLLINMKLTK